MDNYLCSAQSRNRYNSGIVLRKVGILTLYANSGIVPDNSRIALEISIRCTSLRKVGIVGQSANRQRGNSWTGLMCEIRYEEHILIKLFVPIF